MVMVHIWFTDHKKSKLAGARENWLRLRRTV
jgi:hypothetical protein